jgi:hypothetical protein
LSSLLGRQNGPHVNEHDGSSLLQGGPHASDALHLQYHGRVVGADLDQAIKLCFRCVEFTFVLTERWHTRLKDLLNPLGLIRAETEGLLIVLPPTPRQERPRRLRVHAVCQYEGQEANRHRSKRDMEHGDVLMRPVSDAQDYDVLSASV